MPSVCPSACKGLATAAVLISVGVVQLLVGVILLRSEHADLISGPDFLTASSNIGIGCVVGTAASVWKNDKKKRSSKHVARRNVLSALLLTVIVVNVTTAAVLILGEGNQLLTLYLDTSSFAGQVLAGAYVTSVCSPIVCIVVAIVALSGACFQRPVAKDSVSGAPYNWSFDPSYAPTLSFLETPPSAGDLSDDDSVFDKKKSLLSNNLPTPLHPSSRRFVSDERDSSWIQRRLQLYDERLSSHRSGDIIPRVSTSLSPDQTQQNRPLIHPSTNIVHPKKPDHPSVARTPANRKNKLTRETLDELKAKVMSYQEPSSLQEAAGTSKADSTVAIVSDAKQESTDSKLKKSTKFSRNRSQYGSQTLLDYADYLVDQDSLIGLSKVDLLKRTDRIRSLSKAVEDRKKNESTNK